MARLTEAKREDIRNALILGESQYKASSMFEVSSATVNKIFKTINEDEFLVKEVKAEVSVKAKLNKGSERLVKAFDSKVNEELRRSGLVYGLTEKALKAASDIIDHGMIEEKINIGDGMQKFEERKLNTNDIKNIIDASDRAAITLKVADRHAPKIEVNTQNNNQNKTDITIEIE